MKLTRPFLVVAMMLASVPLVGTATASGCPDDPERCVERGATVTHRSVAVAPATIATAAPVHIAPAIATRKTLAPATNTHKATSKPARITPTTPAPATPGMGMLLKLSSGSGGEVSLFPSKPAENAAGASWVL